MNSKKKTQMTLCGKRSENETTPNFICEKMIFINHYLRCQNIIFDLQKITVNIIILSQWTLNHF